MKNRYFGLRHGKSTANAEGIIVSDPSTGVGDYGLTACGREQVNASVRACAELDERTLIHCSDFLRASETARLTVDILRCPAPVKDPRLRERFFGKWDMGPNSGYDQVWALDATDSTHSADGVESVLAVRDRLYALVACIERACEGETILLVSHGDPLQILQTLFEGRPTTDHRKVPPWGTAEIRELRCLNGSPLAG